MAMAMSQAILGQRIDGIWHTGLVVFSREYYFGGGIQVSNMGQFAHAHQLQPTQMLEMGHTTKTPEELGVYLRSINHQFTQFTYNLITNNCNNFCDHVCRFLTGHGIPEHIVNLPRIVFNTPGGAMLRPMIENMQNSIIQQNGSGLDPFGTTTATTTGITTATSGTATTMNTQSFESSLSDSVQSIGLNMARNASQPSQLTPNIEKNIVMPIKASLEENPLISSDASTVTIIGKKILNLPDVNGVPGGALTEDEKNMVNTVLTELSNTTTNTATSTRFPIEMYALLEHIIAEYPQAHMSCLFIVRLMLLHDRANEYDKLTIIKEILRRLLTHTHNTGGLQDTALLPDGFSSIPAHVLAICAISNLLSHEAGADYLLHNNNNTTTSSNDDLNTDTNQHLNNLIDIAMNGLTHTRIEIRQMSATLAYNYTLLCTRENTLSGVWKNDVLTHKIDTGSVDIDQGPATPINHTTSSNSNNSSIELNTHAIQLLCGCLENILDETDTITRRRRLAVICRILRAYGKTAIELIQELELCSSLLTLSKEKNLTKEEIEIIHEINHIFSASHIA